MDTKKDSAVSEVPTFRVARVGKDRKRKGAGLSWLRSGGSRGGFSGAMGGAGEGGAAFGALGGAGGAGGFFANSFIRAMLGIMLAGGIGATAMYVGSLSGDGSETVAKKTGPFMDKDVKLEGDTSNLPGTNANQIPNSLGYLSGSLDGMTPEERARKAAEEAARKAAEEEEARKAAEAEAAASKGNGAVDPNALLASAKADGNNGGGKLDKRFGSLSSSFGGGSSLAGGAGMSGGVGRGFGGMNGGAGAIKKGSTGQLSRGGTAARPSYSRAGTGRAAGSNLKGFARKQLANANAYSRKGATASKGESAAYDAGTAFDNNQGAGNVISGPGIGSGGSPSGGSDGSVNPGPQSGPTGDAPAACNSGEAPNEAGVCTKIEDPKFTKDTKWDWLYKTAMGIMIALTVLAGIAIAANALNLFAGAGEAIKKAIGAAMVILGGILVVLGGMMMMMTGDKIAGGIVAAMGAWTAYQALITPETVTGEGIKQVALKIFVPGIIGGFAAAMSHKPAAASQ